MKKRPAAPKKAAPPSAAKKPAAPTSRLGVIVDGAAWPDDQARALWVEFSVYMDDHVGDLDGFARSKGWASVRPEHRAGRAVLVVATAAD